MHSHDYYFNRLHAPQKEYKGFPGQVMAVTSQPGTITRPHYSDNRFKELQLLYLNPDTRLDVIDWAYDDRLMQWDSGKDALAREKASNHRYPSVQWFEEYIRIYHDNTRTLKAVAGGVNHSNGYEYFVLGSVKNQPTEN
jgi:hypothetical protein